VDVVELWQLVQFKDAMAESRHQHAGGNMEINSRQLCKILVEEMFLRHLPQAACAAQQHCGPQGRHIAASGQTYTHSTASLQASMKQGWKEEDKG
jgi:hypothetical protein